MFALLVEGHGLCLDLQSTQRYENGLRQLPLDVAAARLPTPIREALIGMGRWWIRIKIEDMNLGGRWGELEEEVDRYEWNTLFKCMNFQKNTNVILKWKDGLVLMGYRFFFMYLWRKLTIVASLHRVTTKESRTPGHYNYCRDCSCWNPIRRLVLGPGLHHRKSETPAPCSSKQWKKDWVSSHLPLASLRIPFAISCSAYWDLVGMSAATTVQRSLLLILQKTPSMSSPMHIHAHTYGSWGTTLGSRVSPTTTWVLRIVTEHSVSLKCSYRSRCHFQKLLLNSPPPLKAVLGPTLATKSRFGAYCSHQKLSQALLSCKSLP